MTEFVNDNGDYLEYGGDDITFTKQVASFRNFKIKGDFTVSFKLSNNSENRKALGYSNIQQVGNHAFAPNPFKLIRNGNFDKKGFIIIEDDQGPGGDIGCYFVSGNANWFKAFDFPMNQISNSALQIQWNITAIVGTLGKTYGIIFPLIDWIYYRNKFDKYWATGPLRGVGDPNNTGIPDMFPCLYIHTLVQELAKIANIRIGGDLLNNQEYKTLIMTPEGPELLDPDGNIISGLNAQNTTGGPFIPISAIPSADTQAIELIKWLCFSFGCVATFDEFSQTLSLNILDKVKKEDAEDWSEYFQGYETRYSDFFEHNRVKVKRAPEEEISVTYNKGNLIPYGETDIRTKKKDASETTLYTSPFPPVRDDIGTGRLRWATPFVQFGKLKDDKMVPYTSVTNAAPNAQFQGNFAISPDVGGLSAIVRVEDDAGVYTGYHVTSNVNAISNLTVDSRCDFISNSTGKIFFQKLTKQTTGNRILICIPSIPVSNIMSIPGIRFFLFSGTDQTSVPTAYFSKPKGPYGNLNNYKKSLTYGEINNSLYNDISLTESYWNKIRAFLLNPPLDGYFILPEAKFAAYTFNKFVFIRHKDLTGYFYIEAIENYLKSTERVKCIMNYVDGYSSLTGYNTEGIKAGYPELDATGNATGYDPNTDYDKLDEETYQEVSELPQYSENAELVNTVADPLESIVWFFYGSPSNILGLNIGLDGVISTTFGGTFTVGSEDHGAHGVESQVYKGNNGGVTERTFDIDYYVNGVLVNHVSFPPGTPLNPIPAGYIFIGLNFGDVLLVKVTE